MSENKTSKYLKYAIGEVLLVMIGILLALQVNNWNEGRKDRILEKKYLKGIQDDLRIDTASINELLPLHIAKINGYKNIDTSFNLPPELSLPRSDTSIRMSRVLFGIPTFRSTIGTYKALISEGGSNLIQNRSLYNKIQQVYEVDIIGLEKINNNMNERRAKIGLERRDLYRNNEMIKPSNINDESLIDDLYYLNVAYRLYTEIMLSLRDGIIEIINEIEEEFNN